MGELLTFLDRFEEFFGRGPGDGKRETVMQHGLFQENGERLGKGQSQLVKEFGVIKLLAEDVSEEKAIVKLHYQSFRDLIFFNPYTLSLRKGQYLGD